jgi:thioredoxin 1
MSNAVVVTDQTFEAEVLQSGTPVLVDFWAKWCGPCRLVAPTLEEIARDYAGKLKLVKVDVDENQGVSGRYRILSIPALVLFKGGQPVAQVVGAQPKQALLAKFAPHLG